MKVAVLVTLSYNQAIYSDHQRIWRLFAKSHPDVDTYFIVSSPNCTATTLLGDMLLTPGEEGYPNGVPSGARLEKTIDALEWLLSNKDYDYVVRTGLSSVWVYANLLAFLDTLPRTHVYCGIEGGGFISGAGILMSKDVCQLLCQHREEACSYPREEDVRLGTFMEAHHIPRRPASRVDIVSVDHYLMMAIPRDAYHFRVKFHIHDPEIRKQEVKVMRSLLSRFSIPLE